MFVGTTGKARGMMSVEPSLRLFGSALGLAAAIALMEVLYLAASP